ncbi:MAG: type II toxin-antitoxin system HicB family antitoxin [Clostridia bacterium]
MNNIMEYKGYVGTVEFSQEDSIFFGKVMGIRALVSFEGSTAKALVEDFHSSVDAYLALCDQQQQLPEKAYKGSFNIRISPELHKQAAICAAAKKTTLNRVVETALQNYISSRS